MVTAVCTFHCTDFLIVGVFRFEDPAAVSYLKFLQEALKKAAESEAKTEL